MKIFFLKKLGVSITGDAITLDWTPRVVRATHVRITRKNIYVAVHTANKPVLIAELAQNSKEKQTK